MALCGDISLAARRLCGWLCLPSEACFILPQTLARSSLCFHRARYRGPEASLQPGWTESLLCLTWERCHPPALLPVPVRMAPGS